MNIEQLIKFCSTCTEEQLFAYCRLMVQQYELSQQMNRFANLY